MSAGEERHDGPSEAASARSAEADEAFARGERARRAGRWEEAEAAYRAAWQADPRPELAGELGLAELALGRLRDAAEHLGASLLYPETLAPAARRRFSEGLRRAEREVSSATVAVSRPEAEVFIDGRRIGRGQATYFVYLDPGRHEARGKLEGYIDEVYPFEAQRGRESMIGLHLQPKPPPPPAAPVAPVRAAAAPAAASGPAAGTVFRIGGLALAAAGVALGAGLSVEASARGDEAAALEEGIRRRGGPAACLYDEHTAACGELGDKRRARDTLETAAWASFVGAGFVGAVALSSFWWAPAPGTGAVRAVPLATAKGGGVLVVGAW
ncbi:hypothetical protein [Sorangium sp. Soce836]|uniref:hypothetical protein n=1 Tax=Sorangium sp. So ce836 TaxID=2969250 RepID=UPI002350489B|nr:hypothetical protein [Sorangium sp. Soce836]